MTITIKLNTLAQTCDADGKFSSNIRPHHFVMQRECEVVKSGIAPNNGRPYNWYVAKIFSSYVFVTSQDIVK